MFKLIKRLIKLVLLVIFLAPFILLAFMYKDYSAPVEDFQNNPNISFTSIASNKIDSFLANNTAEAIEVTFETGVANAALKDLYAKDNANFGSTDETIALADRKYAFKFGDFGGFKGATINFTEEGLKVLAGVEAGISGIYYKTAVEINLALDIDQVEVAVEGSDATELKTEIMLKIKDVKIGNLPVFWMYDFVNDISTKLFKFNINSLLEEITTDFGTFDIEKRSIKVDSDDIIALLNKSGDADPMLIALMNIIDELELIESKFTKEEGGLEFLLGTLRSTKEQYQLDNKLTSDEDVQNLFTGQLSSILVSALLGTDTLTYDMHEMAFNELVDYYVGDQMNMTMPISLGDTTYEISTKPLFAEFLENEVHFFILLNINKQGDTTNVYQTHIKLVTKPQISEDGQDLIFDILGLGVGDNKTVSMNLVSSILDLIGKDNEIIEDNKIVLKDFMGEFAAQGVEVTGIRSKVKYLEFKLRPTGLNGEILTQLQDVIQDVLTDTLDTPGLEDVKTAYENLLDQITDPNLTVDTTAMVDAINNLDLETQQALFESIMDSLQGIPNLGDLIPSFSN